MNYFQVVWQLLPKVKWGLVAHVLSYIVLYMYKQIRGTKNMCTPKTAFLHVHGRERRRESLDCPGGWPGCQIPPPFHRTWLRCGHSWAPFQSYVRATKRRQWRREKAAFYLTKKCATNVRVPVRYGDHRGSGELPTNGVLDLGVGLNVHTGRSFVDANNLGAKPHHSDKMWVWNETVQRLMKVNDTHSIDKMYCTV